MYHRLSCAWLLLALLPLGACSSTPITSSRIEAAIAPTFANLVHVQMLRLQLPPLSSPEFGVKARCRRIDVNYPAGAGEWTCVLLWRGPDRRALRDTYDVSVGTDGCFIATTGADSIGGPTLVAEDGHVVRNLLYVFEGCFDTT